MGALVFTGWLAGVAQAAPQAALDRPAFTATPAELLAAGKAAPTGDWAVALLRDEVAVSYDDRGRVTVRSRWVFVIQAQAGVDEWGILNTGWRPSYQDRPVLRARVIDPSGKVAELDPALISESSPGGGSANVLSDRRRLSAPLPRLQIGAVVEEQVVTTDREPLLPVGDLHLVPFGNDVPTSSTAFSYSAPVASKARQVGRKLPAGVRTRHQVAAGRETWTYEAGPLPANPALESSVPGDVVTTPFVGITTAASWQALARAYRAVIEQRIAAGAATLPPELPRTPSIDTVRAITAWLHHQIRYTGIEFGDASVVPWPPAEVMKRGFGDCKDKATLLVALLRQAGIHADVVLLETGPGRDIDPDLPGISAFDHAIVRARVDGRDLWIDATDELARPGQLPPADQGRRALVIADDTAALSVTPMASSADNMIREVRAFVASESGPSQASETSRGTGVYDAQMRGAFRDSRGDDMARTYGEYVESRYGGTFDRVTGGDPADLATPFEMTITARNARRVYTDREQIDIYLYPRSTFHELPSEILSEDKAQSARHGDFAWFIPHTYEVEHRITVPPGFTLPAATPDRTRALGAATFTERRRVDGQTLIVTFRLDTGKPRLTAAEVGALRTAIGELSKEETHIQIPHTGFALGHDGKPREAIAECRRLIALHPREALHHAQLATVLLRAGAGEAARREARAAAALEPSSADTLAVLGWILRFDTLGREFTYDWDRAGAIAALQKAHKLDPGHVGAAFMLAEVLQRDAYGRMLEADADLRGAAEAWRAVIAIEPSDEHTLALGRVLLWSGQFAEAEKVARTAAPSEERDKQIVTAVAASAGARSAVQAASDLRTGTARTDLIEAAAGTLMVLQRYDLARELFTETGSLSRRVPAQLAVIRNLASRPGVKSGTSDPRMAVLDVLLTTIDARRKSTAFWDAAFERKFRDSSTAPVPDSLRDTGPIRFLADILQTSATIQLEGDAGVWRASVELGGHKLHLYLVLDRGQVKLVGTSDITTAIGRYALRAGDTSRQARKLLDYVRDDVDRAMNALPMSFKRLWGAGAPSSPDAMRLAAAVLASGTDPDRVIPIASRCSTTVPEGDVSCQEALSEAFVAKGRWADAAGALDKLSALRPDRKPALLPLHGRSLALAGRCDDANRLSDEALARDPSDHAALATRFWIAVACSPTSEALQRAEPLVTPIRASPTDLNNVAWYRLVKGSDLAVALELARRAAADAKGDYEPLSSLAAIEAEAGELDRAVEDNWRAMELRGGFEPRGADWYIVGRIDEQLGFRDDAIAAYRRVTRDGAEPMTSYDLAQARLAALRRP